MQMSTRPPQENGEIFCFNASRRIAPRVAAQQPTLPTSNSDDKPNRIRHHSIVFTQHRGYRPDGPKLYGGVPKPKTACRTRHPSEQESRSLHPRPDRKTQNRTKIRRAPGCCSSRFARGPGPGSPSAPNYERRTMRGGAPQLPAGAPSPPGRPAWRRSRCCCLRGPARTAQSLPAPGSCAGVIVKEIEASGGGTVVVE